MILEIDKGIQNKKTNYTGRKYHDGELRLCAEMLIKSIRDYHILRKKIKNAWLGEKKALLSEARGIEIFLKDPANPFVILLEAAGHTISDEMITQALSPDNEDTVRMDASGKTRKDNLW